jgi:hypothetical protein
VRENVRSHLVDGACLHVYVLEGMHSQAHGACAPALGAALRVLNGSKDVMCLEELAGFRWVQAQTWIVAVVLPPLPRRRPRG